MEIQVTTAITNSAVIASSLVKNSGFPVEFGRYRLKLGISIDLNLSNYIISVNSRSRDGGEGVSPSPLISTNRRLPLGSLFYFKQYLRVTINLDLSPLP